MINMIFETEVSLIHYLAVSAIIFTIAICGIILNKKNLITLLMSMELMLLSININFIAFSSYLNDISGQIFTIFNLTVAAAEAAIALAIIVVYYRNKGSIQVDDMNELAKESSSD